MWNNPSVVQSYSISDSNKISIFTSSINRISIFTFFSILLKTLRIFFLAYPIFLYMVQMDLRYHMGHASCKLLLFHMQEDVLQDLEFQLKQQNHIFQPNIFYLLVLISIKYVHVEGHAFETL